MLVIARVISEQTAGQWEGCRFPHKRGGKSSGRLLEEVQPRRHRDDFGAPAHPQLAIDTADLSLNRIGGDDERFSHLSIRLPGHQQAQDLLLTPGEGFDWDE